jgi:hypothetical protein
LSTAANAVGNAAAATGKGIAKGFTAIDNALGEGHADGALAGGLNEHDTKVGLGVIGAMSGVAAIAEGAAVLGAVSIVNGIDDAGSNSKGESLLQQTTDNPTAKTVIGAGKTAASIITGGYNVSNLGETLKSPFATGGMLIDATSTTKSAVEKAQKINEDINKLKLKSNGK